MSEIIPYSQKKRIHCLLASQDLWHFCKIKAPDFYYDGAPYLKEICEAIQDFENDDNELLIINMPPRHGKSRTAVNAVQWLLGRNPKFKIMTCLLYYTRKPHKHGICLDVKLLKYTLIYLLASIKRYKKV